MNALTRLLDNHGIEYIIQDGHTMAVDVQAGNGIVQCTWVCLDSINVWHWLGY